MLHVYTCLYHLFWGEKGDIYSWVYHMISIYGNNYWTTQASVFTFVPIPRLRTHANKFKRIVCRCVQPDFAWRMSQSSCFNKKKTIIIIILPIHQNSTEICIPWENVKLISIWRWEYVVQLSYCMLSIPMKSIKSWRFSQKFPWDIPKFHGFQPSSSPPFSKSAPWSDGRLPWVSWRIMANEDIWI